MQITTSKLINEFPFYKNQDLLVVPKEVIEDYGGGAKAIDYFKMISQLDLKSFPLIEDFEIVLIDTEHKEFGKHVGFFSKKEGNLSSFPWWDNADLEIKNWIESDLPCQFEDCEQGWQIVIFQDNDYTYILEGDEPSVESFTTWYKVKKDQYLLEWNKLLMYIKKNTNFENRDLDEIELNLQKYETFVDGIKNGYRMDIYEYTNDLFCRNFLEENKHKQELVKIWSRVELADKIFKEYLVKTKECIDGNYSESYFWFWGYPKNSPELEGDLKKLNII